MIVLLFIAAANAGTLFYADPAIGSIRTFNARQLTNSQHSTAHCVGIGYNPGMALDVVRHRLWLFDHQGPPWGDSVGWMNVDTLQTSCPPFGGILSSSALSFDPNLNSPVAFETGTGFGMWTLPNLVEVQNTGIAYALAADWYEPGQYHIVLGRDGFFSVSGFGGPVFMSVLPAEVTLPWDGEMAFDSDTQLLWLFEYGVAWAIDPTSWLVVGEVPLGPAEGGAGSIDDVPNQTPELLVSGVCPGTVYVTAVDATPGGHVRIASGTRRGVTSVPSGNCQGAPVGLANPRARVDLVANSAGIAATRIQATPGMCGQVLLQALDVDSCLTTSVGTVPAP